MVLMFELVVLMLCSISLPMAVGKNKCVTAVILSEVFVLQSHCVVSWEFHIILFIFLVFNLDNARSLLSVLH